MYRIENKSPGHGKTHRPQWAENNEHMLDIMVDFVDKLNPYLSKKPMLDAEVPLRLETAIDELKLEILKFEYQIKSDLIWLRQKK